MGAEISHLAYVDPGARIGQHVQIAPFAYVEGDVTIGDGTWVGPHASVLAGSRIGPKCKIFPGAVIGAIPQDLKFVGEYTIVEIGENTTIRESATVNRATKSRGITRVGDRCLLMAYSHIAHDCLVGNDVILGNASQVAGEVEINDFAILSGGVLVHQFSHIGRHCIIQGGSKVNKDVPPYVMAGRDPLAYCGLNIIGLRRRGFQQEELLVLQEDYRLLFCEGKNTSQGIENILRSTLGNHPLSTEIVDFVRNSTRGIIRGTRGVE